MKKLLFLLLALPLSAQTPITHVATLSCTQATCSAVAANLVASATLALYRIDVSVVCTTATATATANIAIAYTDAGNQAQTFTAGSAAACTTLGAASIAQYTQSFTAKAGTAITYAAVTANTPAGYQARMALYQETQN